jgi:hypothetical protein
MLPELRDSSSQLSEIASHHHPLAEISQGCGPAVVSSAAVPHTDAVTGAESGQGG